MSLDALPEVTSRETGLAFLRGRIDYERMASAAYSSQDFKLDRMRLLLSRLGNPHSAMPIVHIAGTKGKGSTSAMVAAILTAAGYKTGLYTSPHLIDIEERIAVDQRQCSSDDFVAALATVAPVVAELDQESAVADGSHRPTYFEILTATALVHFARAKVDIAVLEVGLGGRLDSTNVCDPAVTAITSISFDHVRQLGNTLSLIAAEKAGIIKPGVPVVSGVVDDEPRRVIAQIATERCAPLAELQHEFGFRYAPPTVLETSSSAAMDYWAAGEAGSDELRELQLPLLGRHQAANAAVAIAICQQLQRQNWRVGEQAIRDGLANVRWPGRLEIIHQSPTIILDAAHNVASIQALVDTLRESFPAGRRRLLFATTHDKDVEGMLRVILTEFDDVVLTKYQNNPRSAPPEELAVIARRYTSQPVAIIPTPVEAWNELAPALGDNDLLVITGSFFIAGEMRAILQRADFINRSRG
jgi:dihydrofolate synthase / folylpolyglutamate synthase